MGYKELLNKIVNDTISKTIGNLKSVVVLRVTTASIYDAEEGDMLETYTSYTCNCAKVSIQQDAQINFELLIKGERMNIDMLKTGYKVLIPTAQLPVGLDVNAIDDDLLLDGKVFGINAVLLDPSASLYSFIVSTGGSKVSVD